MGNSLVSEAGYFRHQAAVSQYAISQLYNIFKEWEESSKIESFDYGNAPEGKKRFGLSQKHCASDPRLIRVNNPCDISREYDDFIRSPSIIEIASKYIGGDIRFHHCKINTKYQGSNEIIDLHQDFCFDPHTNRSLITLMIPLVRIDENNGPLLVVRGSQGKLISHFLDDVFIGKIPNGWQVYKDQIETITLDIGDVLVLDGSLIHGSKGNKTSTHRPCLFMELSGADALPLAPYHVPSRFSGQIIAGSSAGINIRLEALNLEIPPQYGSSTIFELQERKQHASTD